MARQQQPGIAIGIDFGELTTGLGSILGVGKGIASPKHLGRAMRRIALHSGEEFGRHVDQNSEVAHVYEYGQEGSPSGRLWKLNWQQRKGDMIGNISFRTARQPTKVGAGIDERVVDAAAAKGRKIAQHEFPEKASHLETTKMLVSVAGVQKHTTRVSSTGDVPRPRMLVFVENGQVTFRRRRTEKNEFFGKFQEVFRNYWIASIEAQAKPRVTRAFRTTMTYSAGRVNRRVRAARGMSIPRIPAGQAGVFVTDRGRPFAGYRMRQTDVSRVEKAVAEKLRKDLITQWQR